MKIIQKFATFTTAAMMLAASFITPVMAQSDLIESGDLGLDEIRSQSGLGGTSLYGMIGGLIRVALSLVGIIAVCLVIYGGFKWMTSGGSEDKVDEAKKLLYSGVIGLIIILSAYALSSFVLGTLFKATGATGFTGL